LVYLALFASIASAEPYQAFALNTKLPIWSVAARDVTGDGKAEIFAICCDDKSDPLQKFVAVFHPNDTGAYSADPSFTIDLDPSVSALFFAETDGRPPVELIAAEAEGAMEFHFTETGFTKGAKHNFASLYPSGAKHPLLLKTASEDLDGDGVDEWIIPVPGGYEIRSPKKSLARVKCDTASDISNSEGVYITHRLPSCKTFTLPGEQHKCLAFLSDEYADFAHGDNWSKTNRFKIPVNAEDKWQAITRAADINADGLPDLVVTFLKGTMHPKTSTQVFIATAPFTYPTTPNAKFDSSGAVSSPAVEDVDGDGKMDLVFMTVQLGVSNIINYFLRGKVSASVDVHLFKDGAFSNKPTFSESALLDAPETREHEVFALGDFNGDGRMDAAFGQSANKLVIRTGSAEQFVSPKPWVELDIPSFGDADAVDLNGNKAKDLLLCHPSGKNKTRLDVVLF
jgi:hypothetical protein